MIARNVLFSAVLVCPVSYALIAVAHGTIQEVLSTPELPIELQPQSSLAELLEELIRRFGAAFARLIGDQLTGEIVPFLILIYG